MNPKYPYQGVTHSCHLSCHLVWSMWEGVLLSRPLERFHWWSGSVPPEHPFRLLLELRALHAHPIFAPEFHAEQGLWGSGSCSLFFVIVRGGRGGVGAAQIYLP